MYFDSFRRLTWSCQDSFFPQCLHGNHMDVLTYPQPDGTDIDLKIYSSWRSWRSLALTLIGAPDMAFPLALFSHDCHSGCPDVRSEWLLSFIVKCCRDRIILYELENPFCTHSLGRMTQGRIPTRKSTSFHRREKDHPTSQMAHFITRRIKRPTVKFSVLMWHTLQKDDAATPAKTRRTSFLWNVVISDSSQFEVDVLHVSGGKKEGFRPFVI